MTISPPVPPGVTAEELGTGRTDLPEEPDTRFARVLDPSPAGADRWRPRAPRPPAPAPPESALERATRMAIRRRLLILSAPVLLLMVLVAVKLLTMASAGNAAVERFAADDPAGVVQAGNRMSFINVIETWRAPFALGDGAMLGSDYNAARVEFENALAVAPADDAVVCVIRTNLVLTIEHLGDDNANAGNTAGARAAYQDALTLIAQSPKGCFDSQVAPAPSQELAEAKPRIEAKLDPPQTPQTDPNGQDQQQPQLTPEEQKKQDQLDGKTQDNLAERQKEQQQQQQGSGSSGDGAGTDKPW